MIKHMLLPALLHLDTRLLVWIGTQELGSPYSRNIHKASIDVKRVGKVFIHVGIC